jgi:hypothetical protein
MKAPCSFVNVARENRKTRKQSDGAGKSFLSLAKLIEMYYDTYRKKRRSDYGRNDL